MVEQGVERALPRKHLGLEALAVTRSPPKSKLSNFTVTFMAHGVSSPSRGALKQSGNGHGAQAYPRSEERPPGKATAPNSDLTGPSSSVPQRRRQVDLSQNGYSLSLSLSLSVRTYIYIYICMCVYLLAHVQSPQSKQKQKNGDNSTYFSTGLIGLTSAPNCSNQKRRLVPSPNITTYMCTCKSMSMIFASACLCACAYVSVSSRVFFCSSPGGGECDLSELEAMARGCGRKHLTEQRHHRTDDDANERTAPRKSQAKRNRPLRANGNSGRCAVASYTPTLPKLLGIVFAASSQ